MKFFEMPGWLKSTHWHEKVMDFPPPPLSKCNDEG